MKICKIKMKKMIINHYQIKTPKKSIKTLKQMNNCQTKPSQIIKLNPEFSKQKQTLYLYKKMLNKLKNKLIMIIKMNN